MPTKAKTAKKSKTPVKAKKAPAKKVAKKATKSVAKKSKPAPKALKSARAVSMRGCCC